MSLIVTVHSQSEVTAAGLRSIAANTAPVYEIVIADDDADRPTKRLLRSVHGARIVTSEENLGFPKANNLAAAECEAEFLVICNNDIEVGPGWLEAMLDCADSTPGAAIVVPKYLRPDGLTHEAGGIVFSDASARHVGAGKPAGDPELGYRREVDYSSAAAMLVRRDFWREVGGFDERYSPGYYEDTDLCFAARDRGLKVVYEPRAEVVHLEGATHGTDETKGRKAHQSLNAPKFAAKWAKALERQPAATDDPVGIRLASDRTSGPRVLVVDHQVPSPDLDSGSVRMEQMLRALRSLDCRVHFVPDNGFKWEPYTSQLQRMGVEVLYGRRDLRDELTQIGPELSFAVISRPAPAARFLPLIRELAPQAKIAYDTVDLHFLREGRRAALEGVAPGMADLYRSLERALMEGTDLTICVSDEEAEAARAVVPALRTETISNAHEVSSHVPGPEERSDVVFVGGFIHPPNIDAARHMAEEIMPLVRRDAPDAVLRIVGSHAEDKGIDALGGEGVVVEGWVEDMDARLDSARVMVAPLRYGAGVKGKVTHSLSRGLPVVTTTVGAEGIHATPGAELLIADDPELFAAETVRLLEDDDLWRRLSSAGHALALERFSVARMAETMRSMLPS